MTIFAQVDRATDEYIQELIEDAAPADDDLVQYHEVATPFDWPSRPSQKHIVRWNGGARSWHDPRTLQQAKDHARARVKAGRDFAEMAPFECAGRIYDADDDATRRITGATTGAMMAAMASQPFSKEFTLADNSTVLLDGAEMMAVGAALIAKVGEVFDIGRALQAAIDAVEPGPDANATLDLIQWPQEEPNAQ